MTRTIQKFDTDAWLNRALALLAESLEHWEGEEYSVQEEKEHHINELNDFFNALNKKSPVPPQPLEEHEDEE